MIICNMFYKYSIISASLPKLKSVFHPFRCWWMRWKPPVSAWLPKYNWRIQVQLPTRISPALPVEPMCWQVTFVNSYIQMHATFVSSKKWRAMVQFAIFSFSDYNLLSSAVWSPVKAEWVWSTQEPMSWFKKRLSTKLSLRVLEVV